MKQLGGMKVVLLMCLGTFVCMIDSTIMNITLPAIQDHLGTTLEESTWMLNIYTMTIAVLAIPMARFAEMFGRNKFYLVGLFVFALGSALCGQADSGNFLIGARFIQSLGAAILIPCSMIIGIAAMPLEKRMISQTLLGATQGLSTALGPTVGGIITQNLGWNWVFYVNVPICVVAIVGVILILPLKNENRIRAKIDWLGLIFCTMSIFPLNLVLIKGNTWGWVSNEAILCYILTAVSLILFIIAEKKSAAPMVNLNLFKDRMFTGSVLIVTTGFIFLVGVTVLLPQFLTNFQHKTELQAAMLVTPISAAIFVFSNISGLIIRKIGYTVPVIAGFGIMAIAYYLLHNLTIHSSSKEVILLGSLLGIGFSSVISSATIASSSSFEGELLTSSQSVFSMLRQVGVVLAVAIFVAGLTSNIHHKKQDVLQYADKKIEALDVPQSVKDKILNETKTSLNDEKTEKKEVPVLVSKAQRDRIIEQNFQKVLSEIPENQRDSVRASIYHKVEIQVDKDIKAKVKSVQQYSNKVSSYAKSRIATSFADLYKASIPFVLLCSLTGLIFMERRKKQAATTLKAPAVE